MRKSKRLAAAGLAAAMALSLAACGSEQTAQTNAEKTTEAAETTKAEEKTTEAAESEAESGSEKAEQNSGDYDFQMGEINTTDEITLTMSWWGGDARHEATQNAVNAFMEKYPNIHVETTFSGWSGWEDKMGLAFSQGNAEDIVQMGTTWHTTYNQEGNTFYDLYELDDVLDLSQFDGLEDFEVDGKLAAVPVSMTARTMFWNKATFEKAGIDIPETWEELLESGKVFQEKLGEDYYPMMLNTLDRMIFMVYYLESQYGKVWVEDGVCQYSPEEVAEGFDMLKELEDKHVIPTLQDNLDNGADPVEQSQVWVNGMWAGVYTWNTSPDPLRKALPNPDDLVAGGMFDGFPYKGGFSKASQTFAISSTCEHPREAAALLQFILNEEEGVKLMGSERGIPSSKHAAAVLEAEGAIDPLIQEATDEALGWASFPMDPEFESSDYKATSDGLYDRVMNAFDYGEVDSAGAAQMLLDGMTEHEASVRE